MIKYLFIVINALTVFIYSLFSGDGAITVTNNIPKSINPGQEITVEFKITKGNMSGFAKLQIELPEGILIKEKENKGADFTLVEGIAKWVWSSLPADNELIVKATLVAAPNANGLKTIGGKYSYVENNGKQVVEMLPTEITIGNSETVTNNSSANTNTVNETDGQTTNTTAATPTTEVTKSTQPSTNAEPATNITIQRTIVKNSDNEYVINLKINKGSTKGFARYSDDLPETLTAKATKTEEASFSVADGKIKFVWVTVPDKEELELSYTLSGSSASPVTLNGEYSFLEQNQSKKHKVQPETITFSSFNNTANISSVGTETNNTAQTTNTVDNTSQTNNNSNNSTQTTNQTLAKTDGNINYMVQIGAFTNANVSASTLAQKFNITQTIKSEMQGGFSKFMIGNYAQYNLAHDARETTKNNNGVKSAFVVAYNSGKRITVQEALMITNQKWFK